MENDQRAVQRGSTTSNPDPLIKAEVFAAE